ncbi:hypothetical protein [Inquilinus limosus]|uniref:hypothetical protein n=1 Tax=Inquilinus limosus TaxID=171674 RepID=UPI0013779010|nr:hypothetical protein [Inquilinus limosus]
MAEKLEFHRPVALAPDRAFQNIAIEPLGAIQIVDGEGEMKWMYGHGMQSAPRGWPL